MKYFKNCSCIEDVKEQYKKLALEFHPDVTHRDTTAEMQRINAEYTELFNRLKNTHRSTQNQETVYTSTVNTSELPTDFINVVSALIVIPGIEIELCGKWIWISGNTYKNADRLKKAGCHWASKKKMWYWHNDKDKSSNRRGEWSIERIRSEYGSTAVLQENRAASLTDDRQPVLFA